MHVNIIVLLKRGKHKLVVFVVLFYMGYSEILSTFVSILHLNNYSEHRFLFIFRDVLCILVL